MVSCEIHQSLASIYIYICTARIRENIKSGTDRPSFDRRSESRSIRFRETNEVISRWSAILVPHTHSLAVLIGDEKVRKKYQSAEWYYVLYIYIYIYICYVTLCRLPPHKSSNSVIRRREKIRNHFHIRENGSADRSHLGERNVKSWPSLLVSFITVSAFPSPILSQQQTRGGRAPQDRELVYKHRRMGGWVDW